MLSVAKRRKGSDGLVPNYTRPVGKETSSFQRKAALQGVGGVQNGGPEMLLVILPTGTGQRNHSTAHWAEGGKGMEKPQVSKWTLCRALFTWKETSEIGRHYFPPILNSFSTLLINFSIQTLIISCLDC